VQSPSLLHNRFALVPDLGNLSLHLQLGWLLTSSGGAIALQRRQRKAAAAAAAAEAKDFHEQMAAGREGR